jgi:hypothetical protein
MIERRYALTAVFGLGIAATLVGVGLETDWGRNWRGTNQYPAAPTRAPLDTRAVPAFQLPPLATAYRETVERPLFIPTRRPAPAGSAAQAAMKKGQFRLAGTTVSENVSVAFLFETATNKTHRVNKGNDINGITVDMVAANRVVLKQGEETEELSLRTSQSPKPPPPPPPPAAGQPGAVALQGGPSQTQPGPQGVPLPGVPGGNFGPPGTAGAGSGGPVAATGVSVMNPGAANAAANGAANAGANNSNANVNAPVTDTAQPQQRRRRFQNLPQ